MSFRGIFMDIVNRVAVEAIRVKPFLPTYTHLLASTVFLLYTGAHASLTRPSSAAELEKKKKKQQQQQQRSIQASAVDKDDDDEDEVVVQKMEGMSPSDAFIFPVMAGVTLASLYYLVKWLKDPAILNQILNYYFSLSGTLFVVKFLKGGFSATRSLVFPSQYGEEGLHWHLIEGKREFKATTSKELKKTPVSRTSPLAGPLNRLPLSNRLYTTLWSVRETLYAKANLKFHLHRIISLRGPIDLLDAFAIAICIPLVTYFAFFSKPWYLTNFLGFSFSYGSLQYMSPTTFSTGSLLLGALFLYDIYFVFFTPMMVTVATKLDVPIKLLFPRPPGPDADPGKQALSMLGLGDIIIPGMMIGLALRFDLYLHYLKKQVRNKNESTGEITIVKSKYRQATGNWGERFWTPAPLQPEYLQAKAFPKPYFTAGLLGYVTGMVATLVAMQVSEHPQPALLYLVPGVLIALGGTALVRGEVKEMYKFSEDVGEEAEEKGKKERKTDREEEKKVDDDNDTKGPSAANSKSDLDQSNGNNAPPEREHKSQASTSTTTTENVNVTKSSSFKSSNFRLQPRSRPRLLFLFSITLPPSPSTASVDVKTERKPDEDTNADTEAGDVD